VGGNHAPPTPQPALDPDAHSSRCGVKIAVRQSGTFSKLLP
jgi:hypothetical protein